jgi:hypothetical protein
MPEGGFEMIYYFVSHDGDELVAEDAPRGYFDKQSNPDMFTRRRYAVAEQKRRLKARIRELELILKELK